MLRLVAVVALVLFSRVVVGQERPPAPAPADTSELTRVFLDCRSMGCDFDFFRTEITWVNFVRDRMVADVHVLVTGQGTGGGGRELVITMDGLRAYSGVRDSLTRVIPAATTEDEARRALAQTMTQGLVRYVRASTVAQRLRIGLPPNSGPAGPPSGARGAKDRWNLWVYRVGANSFINGDENYRNANMFGNIRASRVTEGWKTNFSVNGSYNESRFKLSSTRTVKTYQHTVGTSALVVKSLNDHWSTGFTAGANSSKYENVTLALSVLPAIEWDLYPYKEATRRQLVVRYALGIRDYNFEEITIFGKEQDTKPTHELTVATEFRQKWGSLSLGVNGTQFLDESYRNQLSTDIGLSWRIVRGLEFNVGGYYAITHNQINIRRGTLTDEDILLRQRQLLSGHSYFMHFGLSYTFGSIFNNVVNPRFGGGGDRGFSISF